MSTDVPESERMRLPTRVSVCTYNIWTDTKWPERRDALRAFASTVCPDVLCLQEVIPESLDTLDAALPNHERIRDEFAGWSNEGNIYWHRERFDLVEFGAEDVGIVEPLRRLFWVRLRPRDGSDQTVHIATAHYTWDGHESAVQSEMYLRVGQARQTVAQLDRLQLAGEPQLFMGDLNDGTQAIRTLKKGGLEDCFQPLGLFSTSTHPARPTAEGVPQTIDWLMFRGPVRPILANVLDFYSGDVAPSDHKPVMAVFEF